MYHQKIWKCVAASYTCMLNWSVDALFKCCKLQSINLGQVNDYYSFFNHITSGCEKETTTYVSWQGLSVKDKLCDNIKQKWEDLRAVVKEASDITVTVPFVHFKKMPYKKKKWTRCGHIEDCTRCKY